MDARHPPWRQASAAAAPHRAFDMGFRAHNTNVYPQRPDRCYLGYIDGGMFILDISDQARPKPLCRWDNSPPFSGFTHTVLPLFERNLLVVTDESVVDDAKDWPKLIWILDGRDETNPVPIATCPVPTWRTTPERGGASAPTTSTRTCRARPRGIPTDHPGHLLQRRPARLRHRRIPTSPGRSARSCRRRRAAPRGAIQLNDVFVDERQVVYTVDRHAGGLYILRWIFDDRPLSLARDRTVRAKAALSARPSHPITIEARHDAAHEDDTPCRLVTGAGDLAPLATGARAARSA